MPRPWAGGGVGTRRRTSTAPPIRSMTDSCGPEESPVVAFANLKIRQPNELPQAPVRGRLRRRRLTFQGELPQWEGRMAQAKLRDLAQGGRQLVEVEAPQRAELGGGGAARRDEVRVVGVREPVRARPRRAEDGALLEREDGVARTGGGKRVRDRLGSFGVGGGVAAAVGDGERHALGRGDTGQELRARDRRGPQLEVPRARAAQRAAAEERAAQVGGAAGRTGDDALRRPLERREPRRQDAGLVEHLEGACAAGDVELVARGAVEGAAAIGADLRLDAEGAQEAEGAAGDRRAPAGG